MIEGFQAVFELAPQRARGARAELRAHPPRAGRQAQRAAADRLARRPRRIARNRAGRAGLRRSADGGRIVYAPPAPRRTYLHVATGALAMDGERLEAGDGVFEDG